MIKPAHLEPGDLIAVVSPSSPVPQDELEQGIRAIESRGYRVAVGDHVLATHPANTYLAGTDAQRAGDLNAMFARNEVKAIFCSRGGYGAMRALPLLDWEQIARHPKIVTGYSDITSLHTALERHANLVSFHSPLTTTLPRLDDTSSALFWQLLETPMPGGTLPAPPETLRSVVPGAAEGELTGGCLCLLAHACGSPYAPDFRGKIVLIEDVNEAIYRADRDLAQLRNAGLLQEAAGFVIGTISRWEDQEEKPPKNSVNALWEEFFMPLGKPTLAGFPFGHEPNPLTLPLGIRARLDADAKQVTLLEAATV